jgi:hypothetical protein
MPESRHIHRFNDIAASGEAQAIISITDGKQTARVAVSGPHLEDLCAMLSAWLVPAVPAAQDDDHPDDINHNTLTED